MADEPAILTAEDGTKLEVQKDGTLTPVPEPRSALDGILDIPKAITEAVIYTSSLGTIDTRKK